MQRPASRHLAATLIVALALPVSLMGAIAVIYFFGYTFNTRFLHPLPSTGLPSRREGWIPVPTAAPVGFPTSHFSCADSAVNRRFPGVLPRRVDGWRTQRPRKSLSGGPKVSEARDLGDLVYKLQTTEIAINLHRDTPTSCTPRPATGRVWDRKTAFSTHGIATRRGPGKHSGHPKHKAAPCPRRMTSLD